MQKTRPRAMPTRKAKMQRKEMPGMTMGRRKRKARTRRVAKMTSRRGAKNKRMVETARRRREVPTPKRREKTTMRRQRMMTRCVLHCIDKTARKHTHAIPIPQCDFLPD